MANVYEPTKEQIKELAEWRKSKPPVVRAMIDKLPPWKLYKLADTNNRVTLYSYSEDGTVTVAVTGEYNLVSFERMVFGIDPDDLTETDLPSPDEELGAVFTKEEMDKGGQPLLKAIMDQDKDAVFAALGVRKDMP